GRSPRQCAVPDVRVRFLDLRAQYEGLRHEITAAVAAVFDSQTFVLGPALATFEAALARYLGTTHVIGVASGTDALYLALRAAGIGPGDAVLTTPYSFAASATQIARTGARPYFADIEPDSFNLDPATARFCGHRAANGCVPSCRCISSAAPPRWPSWRRSPPSTGSRSSRMRRRQ